MTFRLDPKGIKALSSTPEMRRFLGDVADDAAGNMERLANDFLRKRAEFDSEVRSTGDGLEGVASVRSWAWHWVEYGTSEMPAEPCIRPGAQQALTKRGGRLGESR